MVTAAELGSILDLARARGYFVRSTVGGEFVVEHRRGEIAFKGSPAAAHRFLAKRPMLGRVMVSEEK